MINDTDTITLEGINVTRAHIEASASGGRACPSIRCPVARAINDALITRGKMPYSVVWVEVGTYNAWIRALDGSYEYIAPLPTWITVFIDRFDSEAGVSAKLLLLGESDGRFSLTFKRKDNDNL